MAIAEGAGNYSAEMTAKIIDKYEEFYDEKFPLTKIGLFVITLFYLSL